MPSQLLVLLILSYLRRKFRGATTSRERSSSRNRVSWVIRGIPSSVSSRSLQSVRDMFPGFEISAFTIPRAPLPYPSTRVFEKGQCSYQELFGGVVSTFESNIVYTLRFMIDTKVVGMNWIEVPAGSYTLVLAKRSKCQIEISARCVDPGNTARVFIQGMIDGTSSYRTRPRANGLGSHLSGYSVSTSSVQVERVSSQRPTKIRSSRLPTW